MLEFARAPPPGAAAWELYVRVGLPLAGRRDLAAAGTRWAGSSGRRSAASGATTPSASCSSSGDAAGIAGVRARRLSLGGGIVVWGTASVRPAFYALRPGGWRDYLNLLHPPYTAWHLSYVVVGGCLAPSVPWGRLGLTVLAFALAMGVGAHALDELNGRPLATAIPRGHWSRSRS